MTEPYCWHPDQIARLTDSQVRAYARAAIRREKALKGADDPPPSGLGAFLAAGVPPLDEFVRAMTAEFPDQDPARWPAEWAKAKDLEAARGKPDR